MGHPRAQMNLCEEEKRKKEKTGEMRLFFVFPRPPPARRPPSTPLSLHPGPVPKQTRRLSVNVILPRKASPLSTHPMPGRPPPKRRGRAPCVAQRPPETPATTTTGPGSSLGGENDARERPPKRRATAHGSSPARPPLRITQTAVARVAAARGTKPAAHAAPPAGKAAAGEADKAGVGGEDTAYERERAARVARNRARLEELRLADLAMCVVAAGGGSGGPTPRPAAAQQKRGRRTKGAPPTAPARASGRARGLGPDAPVPLLPYAPHPPPRPRPAHARYAPHRPPRAGAGRPTAGGGGPLYRPADFWAAVPGGNPCPAPLTSDGAFRGDVHQGVAAACGIPLRPGAALPAGVARATRPPVLAAPRGGYSSIARAAAAASLRSNPNAYFYRHPPPGVTQATGPWSAAEAAAFLATARRWGVGSHWGLFASHIPTGRVGYQCAAFYRDVAIPSGAVLDDRFYLNAAGKAVWVGEG